MGTGLGQRPLLLGWVPEAPPDSARPGESPGRKRLTDTVVPSVRFELFSKVLVTALNTHFPADSGNASSHDFYPNPGRLWARCGHGRASIIPLAVQSALGEQ